MPGFDKSRIIEGGRDMSLWDRCTVNDGTESKVYEFYRLCHNALRTVLQTSVNVLTFMSKNIYILLPNQTMVLPVCINGVFSIPELPPTKVWAIKTTWYNPITEAEYASETVPLFKHSLEEFWKAGVAPIDVPVEGSEYFYYRKDDGSIAQGYNFYGEGKHKYFMLLADGGPLIRDFTVITLFVWVLNHLGLIRLVSGFIRIVLMNISDLIQKRQVNKIYKKFMTFKDEWDSYMIEDETDDTILINNTEALKDRLGVRLILH